MFLNGFNEFLYYDQIETVLKSQILKFCLKSWQILDQNFETGSELKDFKFFNYD